MPGIGALVLLHLLRVSWRSKSAWQSAVFAAFAERYQIWAARAHPLVGAAARKGGGSEGGTVGVEERRKERGRKLEVKAKCLKCNRTQFFFSFFSNWLEGWKGHQRERSI